MVSQRAALPSFCLLLFSLLSCDAASEEALVDLSFRGTEPPDRITVHVSEGATPCEAPAPEPEQTFSISALPHTLSFNAPPGSQWRVEAIGHRGTARVAHGCGHVTAIGESSHVQMVNRPVTWAPEYAVDMTLRLEVPLGIRLALSFLDALCRQAHDDCELTALVTSALSGLTLSGTLKTKDGGSIRHSVAWTQVTDAPWTGAIGSARFVTTPMGATLFEVAPHGYRLELDEALDALLGDLLPAAQGAFAADLLDILADLLISDILVPRSNWHAIDEDGDGVADRLEGTADAVLSVAGFEQRVPLHWTAEQLTGAP